MSPSFPIIHVGMLFNTEKEGGGESILLHFLKLY
jgi:hypothetical protein